MAVDVSKIPNNNKFDPVREAILELQSDIISGVAGVGSLNGLTGLLTIAGTSPISVAAAGSTIGGSCGPRTYRAGVSGGRGQSLSLVLDAACRGPESAPAHADGPLISGKGGEDD